MKDTITGKNLRRTLTPEVKVVDASKGLVDYVASDETLDRHREMVLAKGWRFTNFRKNAPFVDSHMTYGISTLLGNVVSAEVKGKQLVERVQWAIDVEENALARFGFKMTDAGYLKAVSVGFQATKAVGRWNEEEFAKAVKKYKISAEDAAVLRVLFIEQEQHELSAVILGANPNALVKAFEDGAVEEEDLAKIGFGGDDEFDFLTKAASAYESEECDAVFKRMVSLEMGRIYGSRKKGKEARGKTEEAREKAGAAEEKRREERGEFLKRLSDATEPSPGTPSGGDEVERKAAERESFLTKMEGLTK